MATRPTRAQRERLALAVSTKDPEIAVEAVRARSIVSINGCWLWQGAMNNGHPSFTLGMGSERTYIQIRRLMQENLNGDLGAQVAVATCETPNCVAPDHLQAISLGERKMKPQEQWERSDEWKLKAAESKALREAIEGADDTAILREISNLSRVDSNGCWIWSRAAKRSKSQGEYPSFSFERGGKRISNAVHRLSLESSLGAKLGSQAAHHKCAVTMCVNPDHLQPVTARENNAEMMARSYMEHRIRELEERLAYYNPSDDLLGHVSISQAA